ncbi:MAG: hypothetical protein K9G01_03770 [Candidatus Planktophila sp.]|nr:hypothetical protein [Candidatus Planktophila sp.]
MHSLAMWMKASAKVGSVFLALALLTASCSSTDPQARLAELTDRVCKVMEPIGYDFTDATIQALDESVQRQLLADIAEIEEISPTLMNLPLETLCN